MSRVSRITCSERGWSVKQFDAAIVSDGKDVEGRHACGYFGVYIASDASQSMTRPPKGHSKTHDSKLERERFHSVGHDQT